VFIPNDEIIIIDRLLLEMVRALYLHYDQVTSLEFPKIPLVKTQNKEKIIN